MAKARLSWQPMLRTPRLFHPRYSAATQTQKREQTDNSVRATAAEQQRSENWLQEHPQLEESGAHARLQAVSE